ncbi:uncharacterized protein [Argopecten irradians]|uniref:uncharacterized protein n=1 Tax=Argopecten irradians TaxID=31199 RepID=UPI003715C4C2
MGVDLAVYRARIGTFVPVPVKDVLSNTEYMFKAVNSVRYALTHDKLDRKGAVAFIGMLLRIQGIEPNPGPRERDQQLHTEEQADENNDIARTVDISISRAGDEMINTFVDNVLSRTIPTHTRSNASNENDGTVAIPGTSSDVAAYSKAATSNPQINVFIDNRKHEETNVGTMNVKHTDNICSGSQTIIHQGNKEDSDIPKKKRKKMDSTKRKLKRNASQAIKTDGDGVPKQKKKKEAVMNDPKRRTLEENAQTMLQRHEKETKTILVTRTKAEQAVVKCLKDYNMVMISGVTGEGKTTLGREVCRKLRDGILDDDIKTKTPIIVTTPQDWSDVVNDKDDIVIFVDDMFGKINFQSGLLNNWQPLFDRILASLGEKNVYMVATSRTHILKDAMRESGVVKDMVGDHFLSEKKTVDLTDDMKLTQEEHLSIFNNFSRQRSTDMYRYFMSNSACSRSANVAIGFPQMCKLFFTNDTFFEKGDMFFENAHLILTEEIKKMSNTEPHKYFALVYCFLNDHSADIDTLDRLQMPEEDYNTLKLYAEMCGIPHTCNVLTVLKHALIALEGTYLTKRDTQFSISHPSIADGVILVFGKENTGNLELVIKTCSDRAVMELLDLSKDRHNDMCTLYVPSKCYKPLAQRIYKMIMRKDKFRRITLESFPRFCKQEFADCLFKYITTECEVNDFLESQRGRSCKYYTADPLAFEDLFSFGICKNIRYRGLLQCCSSNASFLRAFFQFNVDDLIVKERGILCFVKDLQQSLTYCLNHKHLESVSILLRNGAILKTKHLRSALDSEDKNMIELVLSNNIWIQSEIDMFSEDSTQSDLLNKTVTMCKTGFKRKCNRKQYTCSSNEPTLTGMRWEDMQKVASEMNMNNLHAIFHSLEFKEHRYHLMKIILNSHRTLNEVIAIERILGMIDGNIVQYAFNRCELDIFRFLLFSSNVDKKSLNLMLSQAIHLNKHDHTEVLIKAGGDPSPDDFVRKAGTNHNGVEHIVKLLIQSRNWESKLLDNALDAATCFGTFATMKVLFEVGAKFAPNALANVSKHSLHQTEIKMFETVSEVALQWLKKLDIDPPLTCDVPDKVDYVLSKHESTSNDMSDAINHALESGSRSTIFFLRLKGGSFRRDALFAAVKRKTDTLATLEFVRKTETWSTDDLNEALNLALILCRPTVVQYLNSEGALFNDLSLKHVLRWNIERHTHSKIIAYILKSRPWSEALLNEAIQFACETSCPALLSLFEDVRRESPTRDILFNLHDMGGQLKEIAIEHFKKRGANDDLCLVLNKNIQQGYMDVVEPLLSELQQPCDDNSLSNAMDNTGNYRNYDRLRMVRLVLESRSWSVELLMKAMDKSLRLGYTDVVFFLHDHGATFSDQSLEYAIMDKPVGYDTYPLVMYLLERRKFSKDHINTALQMCLEMGHFKLMKMLLENGAELADKSLQSVIHKNWKPSDRHPALKLVLKTRQWDTAEKNAALFNAVKLGDIKVIKNLMECGGVVSRECLTEVLQRKCKPSHRLSLVRLLVTGSLSQDLLIDAREMARVLSEPKVESYIQQFIV